MKIIGKLKKVYVYMLSMRLSRFGCLSMRYGSTFLTIKSNLKTTVIINSIKFACQIKLRPYKTNSDIKILRYELTKVRVD